MNGVVEARDILLQIQQILEDRLQRWLGNHTEGILLTVDFVRDLIEISEVDLSPDERTCLERVLRTKIL